LALHLKRFKYTEDMQRNLKLFHRVVYPPTLRLFNTTDDADDPDRLYELYAVVVHIGGGPYHGHYVTIVKNDETGKWMLIDDEAVEAVDDGFVGRFYGDRPGMASAYVLFYQQVEQKPIEPVEATAIPNGKHVPNGVVTNEKRPVNGHILQTDQLARVPSSPASRAPPTRISSLATVEEKSSPKVPQQTTPPKSPTPTSQLTAPQTPATPATAATSATVTPSKSSTLERTPTKKELKDAAKREKEERKREKEEAKQREKEGKKLGRGLGTIKRWGKDKDKDKS
jgi:ubiquitin carboxyl-terminal hydrolase 9/13